jgi:Zn-finger nucleic acid-binding protein
VKVTLTGLSFRQTSAGRRYAYPDFGSDFIQALHARLVRPRRRGLFRSTVLCPSCERSLGSVAVGLVTVTADVDLRRIPAIHIELEMPGMVCPGCDRRLVMMDDRNVESDLSDALIDAFHHLGLAPG